jgi:two-component system OmpR family sensor kinase
MSRLPIRARLTAAFAVVMALVLAATSLFAYTRMRSSLDETIETSLRSRSDDVATVVRRSETSLGARGTRLIESEEGFVQVLTGNGRWVDGTTRRRLPALRPAEARRAARVPLMLDRKVAGVEGTARILARPAGDDSLVVVTGTSLQDRNETLSTLARSFLIGGPIAVLLASGIGYMLATAGFRPVDAMRRRAARISLTRDGERLPLPDAHDEIRRLGETLNEMLARLQASFERERRFVADASHELRTPLAVVKAELEAAIRAEQNGVNVRESLVAALEETDHLAQLAEDLLLIARSADGKLPVRPEAVQVRDLLERTRQRFGDRAREQGREIRVDAPPDLIVSIDPLRGRQALGNLVDNALRHGSGGIHLAARRDNGVLELDVSDEGAGFSPELLPHAFERFARADGARTRGGAGLGLAIVRAIAEAHGGTAEIAGPAARGATVRLRIPAGESHRAPQH